MSRRFLVVLALCAVCGAALLMGCDSQWSGCKPGSYPKDGECIEGCPPGTKALDNGFCVPVDRKEAAEDDAPVDGDASPDGDTPNDGDGEMIEDGDEPADGEVSEDGDESEDGDTTGDGDESEDGDTTEDGDDPATRAI